MLAAQHFAKLPSHESIVVKRRRRQKGRGQYRKLANTAERFVVHEGGIKTFVNLHDYLDTGLFRITGHYEIGLPMRQRGATLNLFSYTGAATSHAAAGGAVTSTSVDTSATYLEWFKANLALNGFSERQHRGVKADARTWLASESRTYDLIMLDPPSFSNSKGQSDFDVQGDHERLIDLAMERLSETGILYFSTNRRRFQLASGISERWCAEDVTFQSIPEDFARNPRIHSCWRLTHR